MAKFIIKTFLLLTPKRTFSASVSPPPPSPSFTVRYLVESCGLSSKSALSTSEKIQLKEEEIHKTESVLKLLKSHGFEDSHIVKLITKHPRLLLYRVDINLKPKLEFLVQNGFVGQLLPEVLIKNPLILGRKLSSHIKPSIEFLWEVLQTKERVVSALKRAIVLPFQCNLKDVLQPNIDILKKEGVPADRIVKFIAIRSGTMLQKRDTIARLVKTVKELGIHPSSPMFLNAVHVRSSMSDAVWKKKLQIFESWGLSEEEIMSAFRRHPFCFCCSEENLRNTMDFYVYSVKLKPEAVAAKPVFLAMSLDKRIRPRYNVYMVLMKEKLLDEKVKLASLLYCSEESFLKNYVTRHLKAVPSLMEIYNTAMNGRI